MFDVAEELVDSTDSEAQSCEPVWILFIASASSQVEWELKELQQRCNTLERHCARAQAAASRTVAGIRFRDKDNLSKQSSDLGDDERCLLNLLASGSLPWSMFRFLWFYPHAVCCFRVIFTRLAPLAGSRLKSLPSLDPTESRIYFWSQFFVKARWLWWCWWPSEAALVFSLWHCPRTWASEKAHPRCITIEALAFADLLWVVWRRMFSFMFNSSEGEVHAFRSEWSCPSFAWGQVKEPQDRADSLRVEAGNKVCFGPLIWLVCSCCVSCSPGRICGLTNAVRESKSRRIRGDSSEGQWRDGAVAE